MVRVRFESVFGAHPSLGILAADRGSGRLFFHGCLHATRTAAFSFGGGLLHPQARRGALAQEELVLLLLVLLLVLRLGLPLLLLVLLLVQVAQVRLAQV